MIWLLVVIVILAICVLVGRAHSRYLDRIEAKSRLRIQLLNVTRGGIERIESPNLWATEPDRQIATAICVGNQIWIYPHGIYEARLISAESGACRSSQVRSNMI
jgi:hypothetical protein